MSKKISNSKLIELMTERFIIPNWYEPHHFNIENWSDDKVSRFKEYMVRMVCGYDPVREFVEECIEQFEEEEE